MIVHIKFTDYFNMAGEELKWSEAEDPELKISLN